MKCKYSLTFEFDTAQPITVKGEVDALKIHTIAQRAVKDAVKKNPNINWRSLVIVFERE